MLSIKRIFVLIAAITTVLVAIIGARVASLRTSAEESDASNRQRYQSYQLAMELRQSSEDLTRLARTYVVTGDPQYEAEYFKILDVRNGKLPRPDGRTAALTTLMRELGFSDAELAKLSQAEANSNDLVKTEAIAMNAVKGLFEDERGEFTRHAPPDFELARRLMHDAAYHANKATIMRPINEFFTLLDERTGRTVAESQARRDAVVRSIDLLVVAAFVTLSLALFAAYRWVMGKLGGEPTQALAIATEIAAGKLDTPIVVREGDSTSVIASMKSMQERLRTIVSGIRTACQSINTASTEIATGQQDLASRTEMQAANVEEIAASIEELTSTVRQNADNAGQANNMAVSASDIATRGGKVVAEVVHVMSSIAESSRRISEISDVIDGLAFQTNILALNASVEAARAGDQGKGFAVVASEVRSLSQRSAESAKTIKALMDESASKIERGSALVGEAGRTMDEIVGSVKRVTDIMTDIAGATREQSSGLDQVNTAIVQIDRSTQQNASLVEEASAAAEAMREQSRHLTDAVSVFEVGDKARAGAGLIKARGPATPPASAPSTRLAA
ncbi:Methyl-accepting chemotaxis protein I (serine chemoreceptor protein) [Labilithrix luteola]|uniref:Methyl-accepting chemotaxis protein I (Serine chemoreceptor protein) n=1 Tax=Labilithrix luteola TaxID=1391654 RepID=A0A0K1PNV4_9BACT|nr:methyl-accepting chemotaxis protein [Labilithrix luteola]AKU95205.1 Methyl-accepting chemotaxis protein I (serine chemoreceptor protein) [Labilithrix luteola]